MEWLVGLWRTELALELGLYGVLEREMEGELECCLIGWLGVREMEVLGYDLWDEDKERCEVDGFKEDLSMLGNM